MDKNLLDNLSGQELREMVDSEVIALEELDNASLEKILKYETDMLCFGGGDMATIRRCSLLLNERNGSETIDKDKIISVIDKTERERIIIVDEEKAHGSKAKVIKKRNAVLRRIGFVAAILSLMIATTTLVSAAFGVNIFEYIVKIARRDEGTQMVFGEVTFRNNGEIKIYSDIEQTVEAEKLDIMYPSKLPENITIDSVFLNENEQGNERVQIVTNDKRISVFIDKNCKAPDASDKDNTAYVSNGVTYYVFNEEPCFATCCYKGNYYYIQANNYDELILIIENMKG